MFLEVAGLWRGRRQQRRLDAVSSGDSEVFGEPVGISRYLGGADVDSIRTEMVDDLVDRGGATARKKELKRPLDIRRQRHGLRPSHDRDERPGIPFMAPDHGSYSLRATGAIACARSRGAGVGNEYFEPASHATLER